MVNIFRKPEETPAVPVIETPEAIETAVLIPVSIDVQDTDSALVTERMWAAGFATALGIDREGQMWVKVIVTYNPRRNTPAKSGWVELGRVIPRVIYADWADYSIAGVEGASTFAEVVTELFGTAFVTQAQEKRIRFKAHKMANILASYLPFGSVNSEEF